MICPTTPTGSRTTIESALSGTSSVSPWIFVGQAAVVLEAVRGVGDVELGLDDRLAHVARLELREPGGLRTNGLGDLEEQRAAIPAPRLCGHGPSSNAVPRGLRRPCRHRRRSPRARVPITSPFAGLTTSRVFPSAADVHRPPIHMSKCRHHELQSLPAVSVQPGGIDGGSAYRAVATRERTAAAR